MELEAKLPNGVPITMTWFLRLDSRMDTRAPPPTDPATAPD
jgi:hypothetical protein